MRLSIRQYAQALLDIGQEIEDKVAPQAGRRFLTWLTRQGEAGKLRKILAEAQRLSQMRTSTAEVTITTSHPIDPSTQQALLSKAQKIFDGKKIEARFGVDDRLIGGVKMRSDERLYDTSLATAIRKLKANLAG